MNSGYIIALIFAVLISWILIRARKEAKELTLTKKETKQQRRFKKYGI